MAKNTSNIPKPAVIAAKNISADAPQQRVGREPGQAPATVSPLQLSKEIAQSHIIIRNWRVPGIREHFPHEPTMVTVDKYFPDAVGGPLFVDEPQYKSEVLRCERKRDAMKALGHRYLVLSKDTDMLDAMEQLGAAHGVGVSA